MSTKFKKIFHPNSPFYSLLLGLMSFIAVLVSLFTLREMQAQRELALTPMVYAQKFETTRIYADTTCGDFYSKSIVVKKTEDGEKVKKEMDEWLNLGLINVGQGNAVDIEVEWDIDYDWFVHYLDTLKIEDPYSFGIERNDSEGLLELKYRYCGSSTQSTDDLNVTESFSHLVAAADNNKGLKIPIPPRLISFPIACFRAGWSKHGQNMLNTNSFDFEHLLKIKYAGVNGKKYSSIYKVKLKIGIPTIGYEKDNFHVKAPKDEFYLKINLEK